MRILMLAWEYPPHLVGGMGRHVAELVPALDAAGVAVTVITPWLRGGLLEEPIGQYSKVVRVEPPAMLDYGFIAFAQETNRRLEAMAHELAQRDGSFDIIHGHDWLTSYASIALKYAWCQPLLTTIHATERGRGRGTTDNDHARTINGLEWWCSHESWRVIVCSNFMSLQIQDFFNTPIDKISVIPNGVYVPMLDWSETDQLEFRQQFAHPNERIVFSIARLVHEKGIHVLMEAVPRVLAEAPDTKFVIAGVGHQLEALTWRADELDVSNRVFFTGFIADDIRDKLYAVADVAVFPSLYEPFGIVALEAMAAHCPVIVSDTGGLSEVVTLHETGLKVYPDNPDSLAWGIVHTLRHPDWAAKRAENACHAIETVYNWKTIAEQTRMIYTQVIDERANSAWQSNAEESPNV